MLAPDFLTYEDVLLIHDDQIESFGGTTGLRDKGLLKSALAHPQASFGGELLHPTIADQAAAYLYHIAMNHPFIDGNKRTAFAVMDTFLRANSYRLTISDDEAYNLILQVVQGELSKTELARALSNVLRMQ